MKTNDKPRAWLAWLVGALMTTALFALIWQFGDLRYNGNDDALMLRPFMGFDCTQIPDFHLYLHPIIVYPLRWLSLAFPAQAWFSWLQLSLIWFSLTLGVKSVIQCFTKNGRSPLWGALGGLVYIIAFGMSYACRVTYTVTAAMLGAAAVLQVLSIDGKRYSDGQVLRSLLLALVPVVLAYGLRQITALPILAFCGLAFLYLAMRDFGLGKRAKRAVKPLVCFLIVTAVLFGGLVAGRELEIRAKGMEDYLHWQRARISVMDYRDITDISDEVRQRLGWTDAEMELLCEWYFLDENITAEAFEAVVDYQSARDTRGFGERLNASAELALSLRVREPIAWRSLYVLLGALALCLAGLLMRGRKRVLWQWLCLLSGALMSLVMLLYLGYAGRLPLRAALMVLLPLGALVFGILPDCLPDAARLRGKAHVARSAALVALGLCVVSLCAWYAVPCARSLLKPDPSALEDESDINPFADLDELASYSPECLYIYDATFNSDARMFPSTEYGTPANLMFWGGWGARSPEYMQRLAAFGIDGNATDATIFLREDVYLARGFIGNDPDMLAARISELSGQEVYYQSVEEWGGVHTGQFYAE